jgi:hypothetical protein
MLVVAMARFGSNRGGGEAALVLQVIERRLDTAETLITPLVVLRRFIAHPRVEMSS